MSCCNSESISGGGGARWHGASAMRSRCVLVFVEVGAAAFGCTQLRDDAFSHVVMRLMVRLLILHTRP